jgi:cytochrome c oxidase subunit IV
MLPAQLLASRSLALARPHRREDVSVTATTDHPVAGEPHGDPELFVAKGHHGATDKQYVMIALILMVITGFEITISYVHVGWVFLPALLIMMTAKFIIVVSFFMHLKFDHKLFSFLFYTGLILAVSVFAAALATFHFFGS